MPNNQPAFRLFACMKTRQDGRRACGNAGAAEIMTALRLELARRGRVAAHIDVHPCGCLDRCERGPILVGLSGSVAEVAVPPRQPLQKLIHSPKVCFEHISVRDVPDIVDQLLGYKSGLPYDLDRRDS